MVRLATRDFSVRESTFRKAMFPLPTQVPLEMTQQKRSNGP